MSNEMKYNPETVKTVLNVIQKEYDSEERRVEFITSKVQMMLTVSSILFAGISFFLKAVIEENLLIAIGISEVWQIKAYFVMLITSMSFIFIAILFFLRILITKTFRRVKYESLIFDSELGKETVEVESRLIATYEEALKENIPICDNMAKFFRWGTNLIAVSSFIILVLLLITLYLKLYLKF